MTTEEAPRPRAIVVVAGTSGAGRTTALRVLEDLSFYVIDNLPTPLFGEAVALWQDPRANRRIGIGVDSRVREFLAGARGEIVRLREGGDRVIVLFIDAADEALVRRFSESRRPHPLSTEFPQLDLLKLIQLERERLAAMRDFADRVIDTTRLTVHDLRRLLIDHFEGAVGTTLRMTTRVISFGFKYGVPIDADTVFDARFLPNPHFVPELRPRTGIDPEVAAFVLDKPEGKEFLDAIERLLVPLLPRYAREGKVIFTVAIGCTGGRHRSVAIAEALAARLGASAPGGVGASAPGEVAVAHRDVARGG